MPNAVFDVEPSALRQLPVHLGVDARAVLRMRDRIVGQAIVEQQVVRLVARNASATFAHELHRPLIVVSRHR